MPMPPSDQRRAAPATWRTPRRSALRGCERIPSRRREADASRRAALLLLAIAPGYASPTSIRGALRGGRLGRPARSGDSFRTSGRARVALGGVLFAPRYLPVERDRGRGRARR